MSIAAPATNPASDLELKLPATIGTAGQYLKNSSTAGTLEFGAAPDYVKLQTVGGGSTIANITVLLLVLPLLGPPPPPPPS